jgi:hypothetical protein
MTMASGGRIAEHVGVGVLAQVYPWAEVENAVRCATPLGLGWLGGGTKVARLRQAYGVIGGVPSERGWVPGMVPRALLWAGMQCPVGT